MIAHTCAIRSNLGGDLAVDTSDDGVSLVMAERCFVHVDSAILAGELHKLRYAEWCHWSLAQDGMAPGSSKTAVEMNRKTEAEKPHHIRCRFYCKVCTCMDYGTSSQIVARHLLASYVPQPSIKQRLGCSGYYHCLSAPYRNDQRLSG